MINQDKWVDSLPKTNIKFDHKLHQIDHNKWTDTIPKKENFSSVKKYSFIAISFVFGLLLVSAVKNETRILQKEINNLESSINSINFDLDQTILDNEVITSPENISMLAKEYLNIELVFYKRSQIKKLNDKTEQFAKINKIKRKKNHEESKKNFIVDIKSQIVKNIEKKKLKITKLKKIYSDPKSIPDEIQTHIGRQIEEKKDGLKNIYEAPKDLVTLKRVSRWTVVQVVKAFLGMPVIPGR